MAAFSFRKMILISSRSFSQSEVTCKIGFLKNITIHTLTAPFVSTSLSLQNTMPALVAVSLFPDIPFSVGTSTQPISEIGTQLFHKHGVYGPFSCFTAIRSYQQLFVISMICATTFRLLLHYRLQIERAIIVHKYFRLLITKGIRRNTLMNIF